MIARDRPLSVALVYDDSLDHVSGVTQYVSTLGSQLGVHGHDVSYLVGESSIDQLYRGEVYSLARNVSIRFNGNRISMPIWSSGREIRRVLTRRKFDVVHVQLPFSPLFAGRVIRELDASQALVGTFHVYSEKSRARVGARILGATQRREIRRFDSFVSVSAAARDFAHTAYRALPHPIVPNMVDVSRIAAMAAAYPSRERTGPRVAFVGSLVARKGTQLLVDAFASVMQAIPTASLTIAGSGPKRAMLERLVRRRGLAGSVAFEGTVSEADKARLLASADIACFPSLYGESFGVVLLEALAAGAGCVVAGRIRGYADLLSGTGGAVEINRGALAHALITLLGDRSRRVALGERQRRILADYDAPTVADTIVDVYRKALGRRRGKPADSPLEIPATPR